MAAVYICVKRTDIPNGVLQLLDLSPNTSQRNGAIDPKGQTKYLGRPANDTVALSGGSTPLAYHGIVAITPAVANAAALGIIARLDAGSTLAAADVNARLVAAGAGAGTQLTGNGSNGVLANLLSIVAGGDYLLPAGTLIAGTRPTTRAAATFGTLTERKIYASGAPFNISYYEGQIAAFLSATFNYGGNESPALPAGPAIVIYTDAGALYTGP
jgi:hypothetical protein